MRTKDITVADPQLLEKHGLTIEEFNCFFETDKIQYAINVSASSFYGASLCERNFLSRTFDGSPAKFFEAKYNKTWRKARGELLDRINSYALEYYNFRKPLGSPNGKNFW